MRYGSTRGAGLNAVAFRTDAEGYSYGPSTLAALVPCAAGVRGACSGAPTKYVSILRSSCGANGAQRPRCAAGRLSCTNGSSCAMACAPGGVGRAIGRSTRGHRTFGRCVSCDNSAARRSRPSCTVAPAARSTRGSATRAHRRKRAKPLGAVARSLCSVGSGAPSTAST